MNYHIHTEVNEKLKQFYISCEEVYKNDNVTDVTLLNYTIKNLKDTYQKQLKKSQEINNIQNGYLERIKLLKQTPELSLFFGDTIESCQSLLDNTQQNSRDINEMMSAIDQVLRYYATITYPNYTERINFINSYYVSDLEPKTLIATPKRTYKKKQL